jgi:hypothetical protein
MKVVGWALTVFALLAAPLPLWAEFTFKYPLDIYNSDIDHGRFSFVADYIGGSSIFVGDIWGQGFLRIESADFLFDPVIVDSSRFVFVEYDDTATLGFSLVEVLISEGRIECTRLVSTNQHISSPYALTGHRAGDILFFSSRFNPTSQYNVAPSRRLTFYRDGKVTRLSGPVFSTIGQLAQLDDDRFLGVSDSMFHEDQDGAPLSYTLLRESSDIVDIQLDDHSIEARPAPSVLSGTITSYAVSSIPRFDLVILKTVHFPSAGGSQWRLIFLEKSLGRELSSVLLPKDFDFSLPFIAAGANGEPAVSIIGTGEKSSRDHGKYFIMDIVGDRAVNPRPINQVFELTPATHLLTSSCSGPLATF